MKDIRIMGRQIGRVLTDEEMKAVSGGMGCNDGLCTSTNDGTGKGDTDAIA